MKFAADVGRLLGKGLTVHVVEHGCQEHEPADGPGAQWRLTVFRHGRVSRQIAAHFTHPRTARPRQLPG